ncbi:RecX family transcriptional regulator [Phototrophicus methaneseepsis]|uniref:Regulatory protein RecX n=1 Tax=Phototrophicus methaneseepsis TaxID=2710758 RepID=A0A7S8IGN4_9CHLR|nr:RecX family transcriptional regulator [Phototrophicus methaneseepsis]QPC84839.1 RecX family transcriptional regulator [Phototrophicus methaneseepsis]
MPTITLLEVQKNNKERVNVYLDGEFAFGLNVMDAVLLRKGQELDDAAIVELKHKDAIVKAYDQAVQLLARRPYSIQEVKQKLSRKDRPPDVVAAVLERLQQYGYLDDAAFARYWVDNRTRFKPRGSRALRYELMQKGVASTIIDDVLNEELEEDDAAYRAAQKRARRMRGSTKAAFEQKVGGFLQRRGFNYGTSQEALRQVVAELEEEDPEFFQEDG